MAVCRSKSNRWTTQNGEKAFSCSLQVTPLCAHLPPHVPLSRLLPKKLLLPEVSGCYSIKLVRTYGYEGHRPQQPGWKQGRLRLVRRHVCIGVLSSAGLLISYQAINP